MTHPTRLPILLLGTLALAACAEASISPVGPEAAPTTAPQAAVTAEASADDEPRFTPYDVPPRLTNADEVSRQIQALYPEELKEAGVGGMANVWLFIGEDGEVRDAKLNRTSGVDELDAAAVELTQSMVFTPAQNRDRAVAVWVQIPVTFTSGG